ncbi:hypothetical protein BDZ85DRAFT_110068 [Elsinoe ampelina]|uniref:Uncharacterized protein n=1 Tax=Elsinoe ampelina TaxID=302913 RepID=A0A6A6GCP0_9PEZI|nr:hypothetical protein BDZ85DRAFT_110068 [Elsinoe ampelina]
MAPQQPLTSARPSKLNFAHFMKSKVTPEVLKTTRPAQSYQTPSKQTKRPAPTTIETSRSKRRHVAEHKKPRQPPHPRLEQLKEVTGNYLHVVAEKSSSSLDKVLSGLLEQLDDDSIETDNGTHIKAYEHCSAIQDQIAKFTAGLQDSRVELVVNHSTGEKGIYILGKLMSKLQASVPARRAHLEKLTKAYAQVNAEIADLHKDILQGIGEEADEDAESSTTLVSAQLRQTNKLRKEVSNLSTAGIAAIKAQEEYEINVRDEFDKKISDALSDLA